MKDVSSVTTPLNPAVGVSAYNLFDLFANMRINDGFELRAGVTNLFDKGLQFVASSQTNTDVAVYDAVGRSYYIGVKFAF